MATHLVFISVTFRLLFLLLIMHADQIHCLKGRWELLMKDAGISSMHTAVTHYGTVILLDRAARPGVTNSSSSHPHCVHGESLSGHCIARSAEFDPKSNTVRPLSGVFSDTWCSAGQFDPNGTLVQTGGFGSGSRRIRYFRPCPPGGSCHWIESGASELREIRWYSTNQLLPNGRQIAVGGKGAYNFEFVPPRGPTEHPTYLSFLRNRHRYMRDESFYPFLHLLPDGALFILAGADSVLLDLRTNLVKKSFPPMPGGPRTYPAGGSSVLLPLLASDGFETVVILVCGGSKLGAYWGENGRNYSASGSCGRISVMDRNPEWQMEQMPVQRTMGDMLILPTRDVLIINGAQRGCQGYGKATDPALNPVIYHSNLTVGRRFELQRGTNVARVYHSTANLLPDGRILVAGSNTQETYIFQGVPFPSELRLEAFSPDYLNSRYDGFRVKIERLDDRAHYGREFCVEVATNGTLVKDRLEVNLMNAPFATHSFSQGQRLVGVRIISLQAYSGKNNVKVNKLVRIMCEAPPMAEVAPPGYYMVFVLNSGIPSSSARWIQVVH